MTKQKSALSQSPFLVQILFGISIIGILVILFSSVSDKTNELHKMSGKEIARYINPNDVIFTDDIYKVSFDYDVNGKPIRIYVYDKKKWTSFGFFFFMSEIPYDREKIYYSKEDAPNPPTVFRPKNKNQHAKK